MKSRSPIDWVAERYPLGERDKSLSPVARSWFRALPVPLRPNDLCSHYPRVANRLALCWPDRALTECLFNDLLLDKRGGRKGFPSEIAAELLRLRRLSLSRPAALQSESPQDKWSQHLQAPSDR
ncbi:MAG: hypothetical protein ABIN44_11605 [Burkholderiaceae bacterium]